MTSPLDSKDYMMYSSVVSADTVFNIKIVFLSRLKLQLGTCGYELRSIASFLARMSHEKICDAMRTQNLSHADPKHYRCTILFDYLPESVDSTPSLSIATGTWSVLEFRNHRVSTETKQ